MSIDLKIVTDFRDALSQTMEVSSQDINIQSQGGKVLLYGVVDVLSEKLFAEKIARGVEGVRIVENRLTISMNINVSDAYLKSGVEQKIHDADYTENLLHVGADVKGGTAILVGHVDTLLDAKNAYRLACTERGLKNVVNNICIDSAGKVADVNITSQVVNVLQSNNIYPPGIAINTHGGKVHLQGAVNSCYDVETAEELTMSVKGVIDVINKLSKRE